VRSLHVLPLIASYTEHHLAQPTSFRRQDDPQYADDPEFQSYTTELSDKLFSLTSNISRLSNQIALVGTKRETERVRERVQDLLTETGDGFKEVGEGLKKVQAWPDLGPSQKYTQGKLNQEFKASLTEFQNLQRQALEIVMEGVGSRSARGWCMKDDNRDACRSFLAAPPSRSLTHAASEMPRLSSCSNEHGPLRRLCM
jgi:hypothetical protein